MLNINSLKLWLKYKKKIVRTDGKNFSVTLTKKEFEELTDFPSYVHVEGRFIYTSKKNVSEKDQRNLIDPFEMLLSMGNTEKGEYAFLRKYAIKSLDGNYIFGFGEYDDDRIEFIFRKTGKKGFQQKVELRKMIYYTHKDKWLGQCEVSVNGVPMWETSRYFTSIERHYNAPDWYEKHFPEISRNEWTETEQTYVKVMPLNEFVGIKYTSANSIEDLITLTEYSGGYEYTYLLKTDGLKGSSSQTILENWGDNQNLVGFSCNTLLGEFDTNNTMEISFKLSGNKDERDRFHRFTELNNVEFSKRVEAPKFVKIAMLKSNWEAPEIPEYSETLREITPKTLRGLRPDKIELLDKNLKPIETILYNKWAVPHLKENK